MNAFEKSINETMNRMGQAQVYAVKQAMKIEGATIKTGKYCEHGAVCIAVYDANGKEVANCLKSEFESSQ